MTRTTTKPSALLAAREECRLTDFAPARVLSIAGTPVSVTVNTGKESA